MPRPTLRLGVVVVAGGRGERFGATTGKQMTLLQGRPMLARTVGAILGTHGLTALVVVTHPDKVAEYAAAIDVDDRVTFVRGGDRRQDSVAAGLRALPTDVDVIAVHDGARPLVTASLLDSSVAALVSDPGIDGVVVGHPVYDTMKSAEDGRITGTVDRSRLWHAQTPQVFRESALREAYALLETEGQEVTDDAQAVELAGGKVGLLRGPRHNVKVTVPEDLALVEAVLGERGRRVGLRIGVGYDVHAFVEGRPLVLGGVTLPYERGLAGHSDADVLAHALMDAILGAMRAGDIGKHFPDSDDQYLGASSIELMRRVGELMTGEGYRLVDADCVVVMDRPKISAHRDSMRLAMADALGVDAELIGLKATTTEGLGAIGRSEGAAAQAVVLLERVSS